MRTFAKVGLAGMAAFALAVAGCDSGSGGSDSTGGSSGGGDGGGGGGGGGDAAGQTSCDNNPWAGKCWENLGKGCFAPSGACSGKLVGTTTTLTWANGVSVETKSSGAGGATTTAKGASGSTCYTGESAVDLASQTSTTTYTDTASGDKYKIEAGASGDIQVTCPDNSQFTITKAQSQAAQGCEYGGGEPCTVDTSGAGGGGGGIGSACTSDGDCGGIKCCTVNGAKLCLTQCP